MNIRHEWFEVGLGVVDAFIALKRRIQVVPNDGFHMLVCVSRDRPVEAAVTPVPFQGFRPGSAGVCPARKNTVTRYFL